MPEPTHPALAPLVALADEWASEHGCHLLLNDLRAAIAEASALLGEVREEVREEWGVSYPSRPEHTYPVIAGEFMARDIADDSGAEVMRRQCYRTSWRPVDASGTETGHQGPRGGDVGSGATGGARGAESEGGRT